MSYLGNLWPHSFGGGGGVGLQFRRRINEKIADLKSNNGKCDLVDRRVVSYGFGGRRQDAAMWGCTHWHRRMKKAGEGRKWWNQAEGVNNRVTKKWKRSVSHTPLWLPFWLLGQGNNLISSLLEEEPSVFWGFFSCACMQFRTVGLNLPLRVLHPLQVT